MKKLFIFLILIILYCFLFPARAFATYDPTTVTNNHFGIHIIDPSDLAEAQKLVNSNGGDWGYVTFVIQKGERDTARWQKVFDEMRRMHLIPIVRIASAPNGDTWEKPSVDEIDGWVSFLNSLNWVIKNRYVIVGNETNHASEWGGEVNPAEYANYFTIFSYKLKKSNDDFFVMPAALDASATNTYTTMEESLYLSKMIQSNSHVFDYIDGIASHSYPNPGFSGSVDATGKGTVRTYEWELDYFKFLKKDLAVIISETGWTHGSDLNTNIGPKFETAYKAAWSDKRVIAITPFIFRYTSAPFENFSWERQDGKFYDFYYNVLNLAKITGSPIQNIKGDILTGIVPKIAAASSTYNGILFIKNTGESIWEAKEITAIDNKGNNLIIKSVIPEKLEPGQIGVFLLEGKFPNTAGNYETDIALKIDNKIVSNNFAQSINLIPSFPTLPEVLDYLRVVIIRKITLLIAK